jgi:hypothetical protein
MKHLASLVVMSLFFSNSLLAQGGIQYVKITRENIFNAPDGSRIGELQSGTKVEVVEKKQNWVKVQFTAWIREASLTADSSQVAGFTMRASHILVKTEAEANAVLGQLQSGASFDQLAAKFSVDPSSSQKGGDVGEFKRGDLMPEFETAVLRLKIGQTSGAVRSALGYHIIKRTK